MVVKKIILPFNITPASSKTLRAGKLKCIYEDGNIRNITMEADELIQMIYGAVRNEKWETIPCSILDEKIEVNENSFSIRYTALYEWGPVRFKADFSIDGGEDGSILFRMQGQAQSSFLRNRIGICVHHPLPTCIGAKAEIVRPDGSAYISEFPRQVSPHQPFFDIRNIQWTARSAQQVCCEFEGEVFETEDQRNWSDASFKTYSTPLALPVPVTMQPGERMDQSVRIKVSGEPSADNNDEAISEEKIRFPMLGYARPLQGRHLGDEEIRLLKKIVFDHYRTELDLGGPGWKAELEIAISEARMIGTGLEIVLFTDADDPGQRADFLQLLGWHREKIVSVLVIDKNTAITNWIQNTEWMRGIKAIHPACKTGYGTDLFFAELNRNRPPDGDFDFISFSLNPQVHSADTRSVFENLHSQSYIMETAKTFNHGKAIHVSPVTLRIRPGTDAMLEEKDPRQYSSFAAFWTLMTIQNLAEAESLTLFRVTGAEGLITVDTKMELSALYSALEQIRAFDPKWIIRRYRRSLLLMDGLLLENKKGERLFFTMHD
jgi:hypothetical protein